MLCIKRKLDDVDDDNDNNDEAESEESHERLTKMACMSNRYFSSENIKKLRRDDSEPSSMPSSSRQSTGESEEFVRRRDYLMTKLLQTRTLPGEVGNDTRETQANVSPDQLKSTTPGPIPLMSLCVSPMSSSSPASSKKFDSDFIPIRAVSPPLVENLKGTRLNPYPAECIRRAADQLKFLFSENSPFALYESNQNQRTFEIIKLKLGLKSKFENDPVVRRRIERDDFAARKVIEDRVRTIDASVRRVLAKSKEVIDLCTSGEEDNDSSASSSESTDEDERAELMKLIDRDDCINLNSSDSEDDSSAKV